MNNTFIKWITRPVDEDFKFLKSAPYISPYLYFMSKKLIIKSINKKLKMFPYKDQMKNSNK